MELEFLAGRFFEWSLPKDKRYLEKYFVSLLERQFLRYYLMFGRTTRFTEHTGLVCSRRWLAKLRSRFVSLEAVHSAARAGGDIERLAEIEAGNYRLPNPPH